MSRLRVLWDSSAHSSLGWPGTHTGAWFSSSTLGEGTGVDFRAQVSPGAQVCLSLEEVISLLSLGIHLPFLHAGQAVQCAGNLTGIPSISRTVLPSPSQMSPQPHEAAPTPHSALCQERGNLLRHLLPEEIFHAVHGCPLSDVPQSSLCTIK